VKQIILFDSDGVLTLQEELFSVVYARSQGLDEMSFEAFFKSEWRDFVTGKRDLKQAIAENNELWQWDDMPDSLLDFWFKTEDVRNDELITLIKELSQQGHACYLATEQEKYRAAYMKEVMFKGLFRGYFITTELGLTKDQPEFYQAILRTLNAENSAIQPSDVIFFDDSQSKIDTALSVGIDAHLYTSVDQVRRIVLG
jgi:putative hydrolase of the HAD superfamily